MLYPHEIAYRYDGTFAGFLTCVEHIRRTGNTPMDISPVGEARISLYPEETVETDRSLAREVYRQLAKQISPAARQLASLGFLSAMEGKELAIYHFLSMGYNLGPGVVYWHTDGRVAALEAAARSLSNEAHHWKGFLRFSDYGGVLVAEFEPKNRVLPLLRPHFCERYNGERFLIYDRTHRECLLSQQGKWKLVPMAEFQAAPPDETEEGYRALWRAFHQAVSIEGRRNPKLQRNNMPLRFRKHMTEFAQEGPANLPAR